MNYASIATIRGVLGPKLILWMVLAPALADMPASDWPAFGRDAGGSQFSPLARIDRSNVDRLTVAWQQRSGDVREGHGFAGTSLPVTPIFTNNTLYYCTPLNRVFALDGATGEEKWVFDPDAPQPYTGEPLLDEPLMHVYCRGVAYWSDTNAADAVNESATPCARRIFKGDSRGHLYAIDADTGLACRDFGAGAGHPGYASHTDYENYGDGFLIINSPPGVVGDLVIVGSVVQDTIPNSKNGIVRAFDVRSGKLQWEFNPIPKRLRDRVGGGNVWSTISIDPERGLVFLPTTSLSTDYYGAFRHGDSPMTDATVAVDAQTGRVRWYRQLIRDDLFDYDLPGHPLLVTIDKNDASLDVAIQQTKLGELFVFERDTGEPVYPIGSMPAPASDIPGEVSAPMQPTSPGIDRFARRTLAADDLFGLTPWDRNACRDILEHSRYDGIYTPASAQGSIVFPSIRGGGNWGGVAFDPERNLLIARADNLATRVKLFEPEPGEAPVASLDYSNRVQPVAGTPYWTQVQPFVSPLGIPCTSPPWGELTAIDMGTGKTRWRVPVGQARRWGITVPESLEWGSPLVGGPMVTAGGLVFMAAGLDHHIRAFDVDTGERLWKHELPAPGMAVPMTYEIDGRQYVVIAAGGNSLAETKNGDAIVAFALEEDQAQPTTADEQSKSRTKSAN